MATNGMLQKLLKYGSYGPCVGGEAALVGADVMVTVVEIQADRALIVAEEGGIENGVTTPIISGWLSRNDMLRFGTNRFCTLVSIRAGRAWIGFDVPRGVAIQRKEVCDAVARENAERRDVEC